MKPLVDELFLKLLSLLIKSILANIPASWPKLYSFSAYGYLSELIAIKQISNPSETFPIQLCRKQSHVKFVWKCTQIFICMINYILKPDIWLPLPREFQIF